MLGLCAQCPLAPTTNTVELREGFTTELFLLFFSHQMPSHQVKMKFDSRGYSKGSAPCCPPSTYAKTKETVSIRLLEKTVVTPSASHLLTCPLLFLACISYVTEQEVLVKWHFATSGAEFLKL